MAGYFPVAYASRPILPSAAVDTVAGTVTLPLHRGRLRDGRSVWYVLTDSSDATLARRFGLNLSPNLAAAPDAAVRRGTLADDGTVTFESGTVDFAPDRQVVAGAPPAWFPAPAGPPRIGR